MRVVMTDMLHYVRKQEMSDRPPVPIQGTSKLMRYARWFCAVVLSAALIGGLSASGDRRAAYATNYIDYFSYSFTDIDDNPLENGSTVTADLVNKGICIHVNDYTLCLGEQPYTSMVRELGFAVRVNGSYTSDYTCIVSSPSSTQVTYTIKLDEDIKPGDSVSIGLEYYRVRVYHVDVTEVETPVYDEEGNPVYDEEGNPVTETSTEETWTLTDSSIDTSFSLLLATEVDEEEDGEGSAGQSGDGDADDEDDSSDSDGEGGGSGSGDGDGSEDFDDENLGDGGEGAPVGSSDDDGEGGEKSSGGGDDDESDSVEIKGSDGSGGIVVSTMSGSNDLVSNIDDLLGYDATQEAREAISLSSSTLNSPIMSTQNASDNVTAYVVYSSSSSADGDDADDSRPSNVVILRDVSSDDPTDTPGGGSFSTTNGSAFVGGGSEQAAADQGAEEPGALNASDLTSRGKVYRISDSARAQEEYDEEDSLYLESDDINIMLQTPSFYALMAASVALCVLCGVVVRAGAYQRGHKGRSRLQGPGNKTPRPPSGPDRRMRKNQYAYGAG